MFLFQKFLQQNCLELSFFSKFSCGIRNNQQRARNKEKGAYFLFYSDLCGNIKVWCFIEKMKLGYVVILFLIYTLNILFLSDEHR